MGETIRVLQVLGGTGLGGAESRVMDLYRNMDRSRVQFDFAVHSAQKGFFDEEIEMLGGQIFRLPRFKVYNWFSYQKAWRTFFEEHPGYACVHGHMTSTAAIYLPEAKRAGAGRTVAHARSAGVDGGIKGWLTRLMRKNLWKRADFCFTCSGLAGAAVFGHKACSAGVVHIIPNAIEVDKFAYDPAKREQMRARLGVEDRFVVGHVGRFNAVKNHPFLLEVFSQIRQKRPESVLVLLGEGGGMEAARERVAQLGISDCVHFLGNRENVADYYQAMDFLVFPSLYEGMPGTVLEAQACGLPCLMSDSVTEEVQVTELVSAMSLTEPAQEWAECVLKQAKERTGKLRHSETGALKAAGFDVKLQAQRMMDFYEKGEPLWEKRNC